MAQENTYEKLIVSLLEGEQTLLRHVEIETRISLDTGLLARSADESRPLGPEL